MKLFAPKNRGKWIGITLTVLAAVGLFALMNNDRIPSPASVSLDPQSDATHEYVIPAGTFANVAAGQTSNVIPENLDLKVGDTIRIENLDDSGGLVGPYYVGPHGTVAERFTRAGTYSGECAVHLSGKIVITVSNR